MLSFFERLIRPTATPGTVGPPDGLLAFYWHFVGQVPAPFAALFAIGLVNALVDAAVPAFIGHVVTLIGRTDATALLADHGWTLAGMAAVVLVLRPAIILARSLVVNQAIASGFTNLVRWQSHWHVVRQSWSFFQADFAGRLANKVMQTGHALRESTVAAGDAVWYLTVYGTSALLLLAYADPVLAVPVAIWFVAYALLLRHFVPRLRVRSRIMSEARSALTGRIVDSYTNILTVKLFARADEEDAHVRSSVDEHTRLFRVQLRLITRFTFLLSLANAALVVGTTGLALALNARGLVDIGTVAMALPLTWQIVSMAGVVAMQITSIFENIGVVQEGMISIARPLELGDRPDAEPLIVSRGAIAFERVQFGYGRDSAVIDDLTLRIAPGEKIGLVGRSGAGKSTLVNLLLRFFELDGGRITVDGQNIAGVTQESLRAAIAVVTQDTSLLHRSIMDNIRYGRPAAGDAEVIVAARRAHAHEFIRELVDWRDRRGYAAHVGERGVKLSGGQRQRVAIARVILKDAPILILDEATSALDSEVEAAIQDSLGTLMQGKTVIAIAHRLSTIARMDRLVVLDRGRIVEEGTHEALLRRDGHYARLWRRQSGGFVGGGKALADKTDDSLPLRSVR